MYIMRVEWHVKPGRMQEALAAVRKLVKAFPYPKGPRAVYTTYIGEFNRVSYDLELADLEGWKTLNAEVGASPEGKEFWKTWNDLVVGGSAQPWQPIDQ